MPGNTKIKDKQQLIAGIVTIMLSVAMLVGAVVCMRRCSAELPEDSQPSSSYTDPVATLGPATVPGPTLAPNPYGPGDFAYNGGYLTCLAGVSHLGVDVSEYQGRIQWDQVAAEGVDFAMIRIGFRAWGSQGELREDACWANNLQGAADAGLKVGVYFFSQAVTEAEAREEAQFVLSLLNGTKLDMPVVFDWETVNSEDARTNAVTAQTLNACAMAFCKEIEAAGYTPMVYFNQDLGKRMYDLQNLQDAGYGFWLAMYSNSMTYPYRLSMWQYASDGSVPGISGVVDMNLFFTYE